jgi:hypothetical protein
MISNFAWVLALLSMTCAAWGQVAAEDFVEAKLRIVSLDKPIEGYGFISHGKHTPLSIGADTLGREIDYRGPAKFALLPVSDPPSSPATEKTAATQAKWWIKLPVDKTTHKLILLVGKPDENGGIIAMEDDPKTFTPGSNRYLNFCPYPITIKLPSGDQRILSKSSKTAKAGIKAGGYYDLVIQSHENGEGKLAYSTRVMQSDGVRKIYVIYPLAQDSGRVDFNVIVDRARTKPVQTTVEVPEPNVK